MSSMPFSEESPPRFEPLNPYPWFAWMRHHAPVYQDPETSVWYVFGYHDVLRVLNPPIQPSAEEDLPPGSALLYIHTQDEGRTCIASSTASEEAVAAS